MPALITVTPENVEKTGFFCKMSARGTPAWQAKLAWLKARMAEGLEMRLLGDGERGFVEFIPGRHAWRAIEDADDFMVVHCIWVVGKSKGKGFSRLLLDEVETAARARGFRGVAALTSRGNWLISPEFFTLNGYRSVADAAPGFDLMVKAFSPGPAPRLSGGWEAKAAAFGPGLTVVRSAQCPYLEDAAGHVRSAAAKLGIAFSERVLDSATAVRALSPTPYGVYALVLDGRPVAYHYLLEKDVEKAVTAVRASG